MGARFEFLIEVFEGCIERFDNKFFVDQKDHINLIFIIVEVFVVQKLKMSIN